MTHPPRALLAPAAVATALLLAGCAGGGSSSSSAPSSPPASDSASASGPALQGRILVDAAASLKTVFPQLAERFEAAHPGTTVAFNFGGSSDLAASITSGQPVDVFAAASTKTMKTVEDANRTASAPVDFARNKLEIAVPKGNPGRITGLKDFADAGRTIIVCAPAVPCGAAAKQVFALAKVTPRPDSQEQSVTAVLTKVETVPADAGLVYVTDVQAAGGRVQGIPFAEADQAITDYPIAPLTGSKNAALAKAWADYVVQQGGPALRAAGFLAPQ